MKQDAGFSVNYILGLNASYSSKKGSLSYHLPLGHCYYSFSDQYLQLPSTQ